MGPSGIFSDCISMCLLGSGKTVLINTLSGKLCGRNINVEGILHINGERIKDADIISEKIAYVQQDDCFLATTTPRGSNFFSFLVTEKRGLSICCKNETFHFGFRKEKKSKKTSNFFAKEYSKRFQ